MITYAQPGKMIKVHVALPADADVNSEALLACYMGNGLAKVDSSPFFAVDICRGDTIRILEASDGSLDLVEVVEKAANTRIIRFCLPDEPDIGIADFPDPEEVVVKIDEGWCEDAKIITGIVERHLNRHDIHFESGPPGLASLSVPLDVSEAELEKICAECPVTIQLYSKEDAGE